VSDKGKGGGKPSGRYCGDACAEPVEANASEPLMRCRNKTDVVETWFLG